MAYRLEANLTLHSMSILTVAESSQDLANTGCTLSDYSVGFIFYGGAY